MDWPNHGMAARKFEKWQSRHRYSGTEQHDRNQLVLVPQWLLGAVP
jgi:hypothetical protein